jgi:hypothetical protein
MNNPAFLRKPAILFVMLMIPALCPAVLRADIGMDVTRGPGSYQDSVLNGEVNASKEVSVGLGYEQATSTASSTLTTTYLASLGYKPDGHWNFGLNGSEAPEADSAKAAGWGLSCGYNSQLNDSSDNKEASPKDEVPVFEKSDKSVNCNKNFTWGANLAYNSMTLSDHVDYQTIKAQVIKRKISYTTVDHSQWMDLKQTDLDPTFSFEFFGLVDLQVGYANYSYDRNVSVFSQRLSKISAAKTVRNANFGGVNSLIDGFPDRISSAGISCAPLENAKIEFDWSRTVYVLDQPQEDSSTFSIAYKFWSAINVKAAYNVVAYRDIYTSLGLEWVW